MGNMAENRSKLVRMFVRNIGCIGDEGVSVALDDVVCIVGRNNSGKSTLLRAYELAQGSEKFDWSRDRCASAPEDEPSEVILDIHIPEGIGNIGEEWKEVRDGLRILTSRWQWRENHAGDSKLFPVRQTRRPGQPKEANEGYAEDGKAGGADNVFKSRLPQPVRIGSRGDPAEAEKALMKLVLEPVGTALSNAAADANTALAQAVAQLTQGVTGIVQEQEAQFSAAVSEVEQGFTSVFPGLSVKLDVQAAPPKAVAAVKDGQANLEGIKRIRYARATTLRPGELDGESPQPGALDIVPQFILNCLCSRADSPDTLYQEILTATPYQGLDREDFAKLWQFTQDGGSALNAYERYQRLTQNDDGTYSPANRRVIQRHRQNIGTIVEAGRLKVKRIRRGNQGKIIGEVEEYFAQQLTPGDTFYFAGEVLRFEAIRDMQLHAKPAKAKEPKIPSYAGGQMPLSTYLAEGVRAILATQKSWRALPAQVQEWLKLQQAFSQLPSPDNVLVEQFPFRQAHYTLYYTFDGRKANQTLGMLLTRRMEKMGIKPLSFSVTDYGLSVASVNAITQGQLQQLFQPDILGDELEDWMLQAPMLKRSFRQVAVVSGLTEQRYHASQKTMKQVSTNNYKLLLH